VSKEFAACLPDCTVRRSELSNELPDGELETPIWNDELGSLTLSKIEDSSDERFRLRLADQLSVDISFGDQLVCEHPVSASVTQSTQQHFLIDQVLPRILGHNGHLVLHAAAICIGDEAVLLLGKSGCGKSSLAASFERAGYALLGDDALVVSWRGQCAHAQAVYPSLRLFPDSIHALFSEGVPTASVAHYTPKLRVSVPLKDKGESSALPIRAIFVLGAPSSDLEVQVNRKSIADACMSLVENSFVLDPTDRTRAPARLHDTSALAREVPAFDLSYPRAYSRLADVRAAILDALDRVA
jgi:hypothetical protein